MFTGRYARPGMCSRDPWSCRFARHSRRHHENEQSGNKSFSTTVCLLPQRCSLARFHALTQNVISQGRRFRFHHYAWRGTSRRPCHRIALSGNIPACVAVQKSLLALSCRLMHDFVMQADQLKLPALRALIASTGGGIYHVKTPCSMSRLGRPFAHSTYKNIA